MMQRISSRFAECGTRRCLLRISVVVLSLLLSPQILPAQQASKPDPLQQPFANPQDDRGKPRVLVIGDSISIGYTTRVRRLLVDQASVHRPATNCRWSAYGAEHIDEWLGDGHWDVIHFNFGLWDWYGWSQDVKATPATYASSLDSIVRQMKKTNATIIFGVTTPPCIGPENKVRLVISPERAEEFNRAAVAVMQRHNVQINDLYAALADRREELQKGENDVHYTEAGRDVLAQLVASAIQQSLPAPQQNDQPSE